MILTAMLAGAFALVGPPMPYMSKEKIQTNVVKTLATMAASRLLPDTLMEDQLYTDNGMDHLL